MRHLGACMHARVGASGAGHARPARRYFRKRAREMILHGVAGKAAIANLPYPRRSRSLQWQVSFYRPENNDRRTRRRSF